MLVAVLAEQRIDPVEVLAAYSGQFRRNWTRDIERSTIQHLETDEEMLCLHLNRDGIYDTLPELLFHNNFEAENQSAEDMAKDSMRLKAEEKESRSFFQPFENEIFLQRVQLAMKENQLLKSIYTEFLTGIIPDFWIADNELPEDYLARLKKLLPLADRITGDFTLTGQSLEFILKEKVEVTSHAYNKGDIDYFESGILGTSMLGVDTICGNHVNGFLDDLIFTIGPIINNETNELVKNGRMYKFLDCFYGYFIPFELDVETKYVFGNEESKFILSDPDGTKICYLGYNSVIV
jgi:hypothetical protein